MGNVISEKMWQQNKTILAGFFLMVVMRSGSCPQECVSFHERGVHWGAHGEVPEQHLERQHRSDAPRVQPRACVSVDITHTTRIMRTIHRGLSLSHLFVKVDQNQVHKKLRSHI